MFVDVFCFNKLFEFLSICMDIIFENERIGILKNSLKSRLICIKRSEFIYMKRSEEFFLPYVKFILVMHTCA